MDYFEVMRLLKSQPFWDIDSAGLDGATAVLFAALRGRYEILDLLLEHGGDPNKPDFSDITPLMAAIENDFLACASLLLRKKAHPGSAIMGGVPCLQIVVQRAVYIGSYYGMRRDLVVDLIDRGVDVNGVDVNNFTALMAAAGNGDMTIAIMLVEAGADPNIASAFHSRTAADIARLHYHFELAEYLVREGNWFRRKNLLMVVQSVAEAVSNAPEYRVLQIDEMIREICSFI